MDIIKAQENNKDLHEQFHHQVYYFKFLLFFLALWHFRTILFGLTEQFDPPHASIIT